MIQERKPSIFIQFAGQGVKYMDELRRLYKMYPDVRPFIQEAIAEIKRQASQYDDTETGFFVQGLDVDRWIEHPEETPDLAYLLSSPLSHPLIYLCQIATFISVLQEGLDPEWLLSRTHSATGFSTGIVAAVLISMGLSLEELQQLAVKVQAMFFWQGVRCQQSIFRFGVQPVLEVDNVESAEGSPSCMASINGLSRGRLDELIDAYSDYGVVHPAYELLPDRCIVAGLPESLVAFNRFLKLHEKEASGKFIPSTIAAHCPFLTYALETSPIDAERIGLELSGDQLEIPVWSNDTGADLRASQNIVWDVMQAYFMHTASWRSQIASLLEPNGITHVLDFGPGPGVASLTENHIPGSDIQVIRCTVPLGRRRLFDEVLPALNGS
ncbi:MAG: ACP S-malonyltransferase [Proteobacteria bacterium]|nr:ACP S-malonyltransferase [Pseudomonadota bacterium]